MHKAFVTDVSGAKEHISILFNMVSKVLTLEREEWAPIIKEAKAKLKRP
jgi:hypothetical protein